MTNIGPLMSLLLHDPLTMHKSAVALGATCQAIALREPEKARNVVRRYMWHLSEESGNIGWGIPEAFAETLVASPLLAKEFQRILITYVIDLGKEDNYCDNDILRRSCYWACGRVAQANAEATRSWGGWLAKGLSDGDFLCRGMAAWALSFMPADLMTVPLLTQLARDERGEVCTLFDGEALYVRSPAQLAQETLTCWQC